MVAVAERNLVINREFVVRELTIKGNNKVDKE